MSHAGDDRYGRNGASAFERDIQRTLSINVQGVAMLFHTYHPRLSLLVAAAALVFAGSAFAEAMKVDLSGSHEVPPVTTNAKADGTITIAADRSVSGSVATTGIDATMAHIHQAAAGKNGPIIIPLTKDGNKWVVPAGAKLTEAQEKAFKAGDLYVNVHSAAHPGGEIRAQLKP